MLRIWQIRDGAVRPGSFRDLTGWHKRGVCLNTLYLILTKHLDIPNIFQNICLCIYIYVYHVYADLIRLATLGSGFS